MNDGHMHAFTYADHGDKDRRVSRCKCAESPRTSAGAAGHWMPKQSVKPAGDGDPTPDGVVKIGWPRH